MKTILYSKMRLSIHTYTYNFIQFNFKACLILSFLSNTSRVYMCVCIKE